LLLHRWFGSAYLGLRSSNIGGHDDFVVGPSQDRYYLDPDVLQKCEELRSNQPLFLDSSVRHWTHLESILPSRMGRMKMRYINQYKISEFLLTGTLN